MIDKLEMMIDISQFSLVIQDKAEKWSDITQMCCDKSVEMNDKDEKMGDKRVAAAIEW